MRKLLLEWVEINKFRELNKRQLNKIREDYIVFKGYKKDSNGQLSSDQEQDVQATVEKVLNTIIKEIDPTYNARKENYANQYQQWILTQFQKQSKNVAVFDEDLPKYRTQIERYIKYKLPTQITKYSTLQDLLTQLNTYEQENNLQPQKTGNNYSNIPDSLEIFINNGELLFIKEFDKYMMYIPLTEEQSIQVGTDTEWCTQYTERPPLFYNYAKSPLFSIRSKAVYKDNYQFYFFPKNQNIKDNQDDNIDEIKFCEEHPDIIQFFKDFVSGNQNEIFNKIKIAYNNIYKNISNDIDITDYGFYYDEKKDENGNYGQYIIQDDSGDIFQTDQINNIIAGIIRKNQKNKDWLSWDLNKLFDEIQYSPILHSLMSDKINNSKSVEESLSHFENLVKIYTDNIHGQPGYRSINDFCKCVIKQCNEEKTKAFVASGKFNKRLIYYLNKMSDGIFLKKCPQEYISTDDKIKVMKLALDQGNNIKGLEILDNIDFTIQKDSEELQKKQIESSLYGLLAVYKQMMPSEDLFRYQIDKRNGESFALLLDNLIPDRIPNTNIFDYQIEKITTAYKFSKAVIRDFVFSLQIVYSKYPTSLNLDSLKSQYNKNINVIQYIFFFPKVFRNYLFTNLVNTKYFVFDMIKDLFDKILNELTGVKETNLYKLGFDQEIMYQILKSIFYGFIYSQHMYNTVNIICFKDIFKKWFKDAPSEDKDNFKQLFLTIFDTIINEEISTKDSQYFYNIIEDLIIQGFNKPITEISKELILKILNKSLLFFKPFHYLIGKCKSDFMNIKIYPKDIYDIYINSNNKSIEIIDIFTLYGLNLKRNGKQLVLDDVIPESDLYNIIKNEEDLMILSFFNNLSDNFLLKLYDKLGGKEYLTTQYFFSKYNDRIKELLVKKEQKNLFKKLLNI